MSVNSVGGISPHTPRPLRGSLRRRPVTRVHRGDMMQYICAFMLCVFIARVQDIFPVLSHFRVGVISMFLGILAMILYGRLQYVLNSKGTRLIAALWLYAVLTIPFSVWKGGAFVFCEKELTTLLIFYCVIVSYATNVDNCLALVKGVNLCGFLLCFEIMILCTPSIAHGLIGTRALDRNDLALTLVSIFPFVLTVFQTGKKFERLWSALLLALFVFAILRTGSRGGVIGLFFIALASTFAHRAKLRTKVLVAGLCFVSIFFFSKSLITRFEAVWNGTDYNYTVGRIELWKEGSGLFWSHLPTGVGAGQYITAMGMTYGSTAWRAPHNVLLEIGVDLGVPGLILFIAIIYSIWENTRRGLASIAGDRNGRLKVLLLNVRVSLLGYLVCGLFLSQAYSPLVPFLLALSGGLALTALRTEAHKARLSGQVRLRGAYSCTAARPRLEA